MYTKQKDTIKQYKYEDNLNEEYYKHIYKEDKVHNDIYVEFSQYDDKMEEFHNILYILVPLQHFHKELFIVRKKWENALKPVFFIFLQ